MAVLTPEQQQQYYATQGNAANPLSPDQYLASLTPTNTITSESLQPVQPLQLPKDSPNDALDAQNSLATLGSIGDLANPAPTAEETQQNSLSQQLLETVNKLGGKEQAQAKAEQDAGLPGFQTQLTDINGQIQTLQKESAAIPLQLQEQFAGRGVTAGGLAPIQAGALRQNAIKALGLSAIAQTLQGNVALAQQTADRAIKAEFAPEEAKLKYLQAAYNMNKDALERQDKKRADQLAIQLDERKRKLDQQKEDRNTIMGFAAEAAKLGNAPSLVLNRALASNDPMQALQLLSPYLSDPNAKESALLDLKYKRAQIDQINANIRKTNSETKAGLPGVTNPQAGQYSGALQVILGSAKFTKDQKASVINAVNSGDDPFTVVKNQAKSIMGQTEATTVTKYETAKSSLQDIQNNLAAFYAQGGDTNIFKGTYEKVINKLGEVKDPALVDLSTQIQANLQVYRNAVSGTAYSEQEGQDISAIFPGINKTEGLNTAILNGRMKAFDSTIDGTYRSALGSTYDDLRKAQINQSKGNLSDRDFVAEAVKRSGQSYNSFIGGAKAGEIPVVDNATGEIGYIPVGEFNKDKYTKL